MSADTQHSRKRPREEIEDADQSIVSIAGDGASDAAQQETAEPVAKSLRLESEDAAVDDGPSSSNKENSIIAVEPIEAEVRPPQFSRDALGVSLHDWRRQIDSCHSSHELTRKKADQYIKEVDAMMKWSREHQELLQRVATSPSKTPAEVEPLDNPFDADVIIEVGSMYTNKQQYHGFFIAHRFMLRQSCDFFRNALRAEPRQSQAPYVIQKPNATPDSIKAVLQYLYAGVVGPVSLETLKECFLLAKELKLSDMILDLVFKLVDTDPRSILVDNIEAFIHLHSFFQEELQDGELASLFFEPLLHGAFLKWPHRFTRASQDTIISILKFDESDVDETVMLLALIGWALAKIGHDLPLKHFYPTEADLSRNLPLVSVLPTDQRAAVKGLIREPAKYIRWGCIGVDWFKRQIDGKQLLDVATTVDVYRSMVSAPMLYTLDNIQKLNEKRDGSHRFVIDDLAMANGLTEGFMVNGVNFVLNVDFEYQNEYRYLLGLNPTRVCSVSLTRTPTKVGYLGKSNGFRVYLQWKVIYTENDTIGDTIKRVESRTKLNMNFHFPCSKDVQIIEI